MGMIGVLLLLIVIIIIAYNVVVRLASPPKGNPRPSKKNWQPSEAQKYLANSYIESIVALEHLIKSGAAGGVWSGVCVGKLFSNTPTSLTMRVKAEIADDNTANTSYINDYRRGLINEDTMLHRIGSGLSENEIGKLAMWEYSVNANDNDRIIAQYDMSLEFQAGDKAAAFQYFIETLHQKKPSYNITIFYPTSFSIRINRPGTAGALEYK